jgi:DNA polymerase iota
MSRYQYFDELSGDSSDGYCSSDAGDDEVDDEATDLAEKSDLCGFRTILHADVDCFYCQCEVLDRGLDPNRPLAIGQKHIVVTCNYAARTEGVTKLMYRTDALLRCPNLLIVDGSDLQRYRIHGRQIYVSFRRAIQSIFPSCSIRKGCMDEMMADILAVPSVDCLSPDSTEDVFIYNDSSHGSSVIPLIEDQSGAVTFCARNKHQRIDSFPKAEAISPGFLPNLRRMALLSLQIRQTILNETGFATTMGVSFNPMMAKLASGLRKPGKVNVLEPCNSSRQLVESMPLRKVPGIGSRTMKVLIPCLETRHGSKVDTATSPWTCR